MNIKRYNITKGGQHIRRLHNVVVKKTRKNNQFKGETKMARIDELKQTIEEIKGADELNKEDFLKFFDKNYWYEGGDGCFYIHLSKGEVHFELFFTNSSIYEIMKYTEEYNEIEDNFSEETIERYEDRLRDGDNEYLYCHNYTLNIHDEEEKINEIVLDYYFNNETEIDEEVIYQASNYIVEETIDQLNQLIEDEED